MVETPDTIKSNTFGKKTNPFGKNTSTPKSNPFSTPRPTSRVLAPEMGASLTPSLEEEEENNNDEIISERKTMLTPRLTPKSKWQNGSQCKCCDSPFTSLKRRHHCRRCGMSCCQKCSKSRIVFGDSNEEIRICQACSNNMLVSEEEVVRLRDELTKLKVT
jgi:hypothetical protein